jgi:hypothetical protein
MREARARPGTTIEHCGVVYHVVEAIYIELNIDGLDTRNACAGCVFLDTDDCVEMKELCGGIKKDGVVFIKSPEQCARDRVTLRLIR